MNDDAARIAACAERSDLDLATVLSFEIAFFKFVLCAPAAYFVARVSAVRCVLATFCIEVRERYFEAALSFAVAALAVLEIVREVNEIYSTPLNAARKLRDDAD